jgi:ATP-dependent Clp protease ATP-binding subunit ClpA
LTDKDIASICAGLLKGVKRTLKSNNGKIVNFSKDVSDYILSKSRDVAYGARPLKRLITEFIETPLAEFIISNDSSIRKINAEVVDDKLEFTSASAVQHT